MNHCKHFQKLKVDQIQNIASQIKRLDICEAQTKHVSKQIGNPTEVWVCLDCGNKACSKFSSNGCSKKHYTEQKHRFAIGVNQLFVYCFECEDDLQSILDSYEGASTNASKKLETFLEKVKGIFFKLNEKFKAEKQPHTLPLQLKVEQKPTQTKQSEPHQNNALLEIPPAVFGLTNLGNTCFFNSVLQCLSGTTELVSAYLSPDNDFQQSIDVWEEIQAEETQSQSKKDEDDEWCSVKPKKKAATAAFTVDNSKYTQMPVKKINQLFQQFLVSSRSSKSRQISPTDLLKAVSSRFVRFKAMEQEDAFDLLRCMLDSLIIGEEKWQKINKSSEKQLGKQRNTLTEKLFVRCLECGHVSRSFDFCMDIALPVAQKRSTKSQSHAPLDILGDSPSSKETPSKTESSAMEVQDQKREEPMQEGAAATHAYQKIEEKELQGLKIPYLLKNSTLFEPSEYTSGAIDRPTQAVRKLECLFDEFCAFEQLTKANNYYKCEKCGKSQRSLRKYFLYEPPRVLTLVLKRFVQTGNSTFEKLNTHVEILETINIDPYTIVKGEDINNPSSNKQFKKFQNYELYATVNHHGSMSHGHYTAFVKHDHKGQSRWFHYSDASFHETNFANVKASQSYILFYKRVD